MGSITLQTAQALLSVGLHLRFQYKAKQISEIILLRPNVLNGKTIGLLTGNEDDKLAPPFFVQTKTHLAKFLGDATLKYCENKGVIKTKAFEYIRGYSFENALVIVEEGARAYV